MASRGSRRRCWNVSLRNRTRACATSAPRSTPTARFYPIISQMERAAGLVHDDTAQAKLDKLDAMLAQTSTSKQDAALFAEMLSLPNDGRYPALELEPQQRRQKTLEALTAQVEALSRQNPLLMIFEDAHWTDPTSLEVFGRVVDRVRSLPVLLIVTFRPEFEPPWIGRPYVTALTINRLAQRDIEAMIDRVVGNKLIPASVRQDIIERTDGIPLFVEEMTKAVLEAESEGDARTTARRRSLAGSGGARELTSIANGAARPPRARQGSGADRRGYRARVLACTTGRGDPQGGSRTPVRPRPSNGGRFAVPAGCAATRDLFVQARTGTGRGLWHAVARSAPRAARPHC